MAGDAEFGKERRCQQFEVIRAVCRRYRGHGCPHPDPQGG